MTRRIRPLDDDRLRCQRCLVLRTHCICEGIPTLQTAVRLLVVRHESESRRSTNTALVAALALPGLVIVDYDDEPARADRQLAGMVQPGDGSCLVYPGEPRSEWPADPPRRLVFLDGTWRQTRRMARKLGSLGTLPRLWLPDRPEPALRLRRSATPEGRSTLEAIADALLLAGEAVPAAALSALHATYVECVLRARGEWRT